MQLDKMIRRRNWLKEYQRSKSGERGLEHPTAFNRMKALFERERIPYHVISHPETFTAPELAASIHTTGRRVAKVVVLWADGRHVIAVLPSHRQMDLDRFAQTIGARRLSLATEAEMEKLFPDCELGAMPPLGELYGLPVYVDESLALEPEIVFQAGSHHEVIVMKYRDFERLARPMKGHFTLEPVKTASGF